MKCSETFKSFHCFLESSVLMGKTKRWGKNYEDKRDWNVYNSQLVRRGEFYISPRFLGTWLEETKAMNCGKVGNPYLYPNSMIEFLAVLHSKGFDYRALEGVMRALSKNMLPFPVISYSQISRRVNALEIAFGDRIPSDGIVACDGTGIKVSNRGDWIRKKWKVKRGWIKVVILGTTSGEVVDVRVGDENLDERKAGRGMLRKNKPRKAIADGLHDCKETFDLCDKLNIETAIKIRKNASTKARGNSARKKEVIRYKELGYEGWCQETQYGLRWPASEGIFSAVKRMFGESVRATNELNAYKEAKMKFWAYNKVVGSATKTG